MILINPGRIDFYICFSRSRNMQTTERISSHWFHDWIHTWINKQGRSTCKALIGSLTWFLSGYVLFESGLAVCEISCHAIDDIYLKMLNACRALGVFCCCLMGCWDRTLCTASGIYIQASLAWEGGGGGNSSLTSNDINTKVKEKTKSPIKKDRKTYNTNKKQETKINWQT